MLNLRSCRAISSSLAIGRVDQTQRFAAQLKAGHPADMVVDFVTGRRGSTLLLILFGVCKCDLCFELWPEHLVVFDGGIHRWQSLSCDGGTKEMAGSYWDLFGIWEACIEEKIASVYFLHASDNTVGYDMVTMVTYLARQTEMAVYIFKWSTPCIYFPAHRRRTLVMSLLCQSECDVLLLVYNSVF